MPVWYDRRMTTTVDDKIIEKIQKLLALATSDNVNESANAAARAQELMTKHRLELADVEAMTPGVEADKIETITVDLEKSNIAWKTALAAGIAVANDCRSFSRHFMVGGKQTQVGTCYVGPQSSLATMAYMYKYLVREIDRLAALNRGKPGATRKWLRDFRMGAVAEITTRLISASKAAKVGASGTALAVVNKTLERVEEAIEQMGLKQGKEPTVKDAGAFHAGRRAGATIDISSGKGLGAGAAGALEA